MTWLATVVEPLGWSTFQIFLVALGGACVCVDLGRRIGRAHVASGKGPTGGVLASALAAHLALLGFVLAFTFGLAATRLGERKFLVIDEANAIGTAGLRASALPEPRASNIRRILAEYTELRVRVARRELSGVDATPRNDVLVRELWKETRLAVLEGKPSEPFVALFAESVNEVIDTGTKRTTVVYRHQVPRPFWIVLSVIGSLCMVMLGYQSGFDKAARLWVTLPLAASLALMVMLIAELDAPTGIVRLSQEPMLGALRELREIPR